MHAPLCVCVLEPSLKTIYLFAWSCLIITSNSTQSWISLKHVGLLAFCFVLFKPHKISGWAQVFLGMSLGLTSFRDSVLSLDRPKTLGGRFPVTTFCKFYKVKVVLQVQWSALNTCHLSVHAFWFDYVNFHGKNAKNNVIKHDKQIATQLVGFCQSKQPP